MTSCLIDRPVWQIDKIQTCNDTHWVRFGTATKGARIEAYKKYEKEHNGHAPIAYRYFDRTRLFELWNKQEKIIGMLSLSLDLFEPESDETGEPHLSLNIDGAFVQNNSPENMLDQSFGRSVGYWLGRLALPYSKKADRISIHADFMTEEEELTCRALGEQIDLWTDTCGLKFDTDWGY